MRVSKAKVGDVYRVIGIDDKQVYFQFIVVDPCQLNSEVIRVFNTEQDSPEEESHCENIFMSKVQFYAHTNIKLGIKLGLWEKVGKGPVPSKEELPLFRDTFGHVDEYDGNKIIYSRSNAWNIWKAGEKFESRRVIGYLTAEAEKIDIGIIYAPIEIITKIKTGSYSYPYYT